MDLSSKQAKGIGGSHWKQNAEESGAPKGTNLEPFSEILYQVCHTFEVLPGLSLWRSAD
jgi:hypothetical protein